MKTIIYPLVAKGEVLSADGKSIRIHGRYGTLGIMQDFAWDQTFKPGDTIYYSYALSKGDFSAAPVPYDDQDNVRGLWYDVDMVDDPPT